MLNRQSVDYQVSPARAGMVPEPRAQFGHQLSFPRASGDGPHHVAVAVSTDQFPPRERGWSRRWTFRWAKKYVSPARAGMVPDAWRCSWVRFRFPRASGDGPLGHRVNLDHRGFPPRERGWSLNVAHESASTPVSPARAGMVRKASRRKGKHMRFPRASGDGPRCRSGASTSRRFPPRERGWSLPHAARHCDQSVSPARAGMVPIGPGFARLRLGFPRASGDGPDASIAADIAAKFPPRERGWSLLFVASYSAARVSPARAGMVPATLCSPFRS